MMAALLVILFVAMIAAPCVVALRSTPKSGEDYQVEAEVVVEELPLPAPIALIEEVEDEPIEVTPKVSLQLLAEEAEQEARVAEDWARKAHWAALDAAARAAALRADAAAELATLASLAADQAIRAAEAEFGEDFLDEMYLPSNDRRAA